MALVAAASGIRSDWLDGVMRPLGIAESHRVMEGECALVVLYIARVLQAVKGVISERWKDFGHLNADAVFYNMAVPGVGARP